MATISVQEQLDILSKSKTIPTSLHGNGMFNAIIFAAPQIKMNPTVKDVQGRVWDHIDGSYYYKLPTGSYCPIFYIDRYK
ncbi:MAG: hypothetical protein CML42_09470 [Rhodobacteraceae bacterium]|nr:hypothetical protein [Paracoccaceae bacterium]